jgi:hypothetical protein
MEIMAVVTLVEVSDRGGVPSPVLGATAAPGGEGDWDWDWDWLEDSSLWEAGGALFDRATRPTTTLGGRQTAGIVAGGGGGALKQQSNKR